MINMGVIAEGILGSIGGGGGGTPSLLASIEAVQTGLGVSNSTTGAGGGATSIDTTGATLLLAIVRSVTGGSPTATLTDSESNTWSLGTQFGSAGHSAQIAVAWVSNPITSSTHTFTANNQDGSCEVYAFTGGTSWTLDTEAGSGSATSGTSVATGSITPSVGAGQIVIAGISSNGSLVTATINNGFSGGITGQPTDTALTQNLNGAVPEVGGSGVFVTTGSGSISATFTTSVSNSDWQWVIAAFKS